MKTNPLRFRFWLCVCALVGIACGSEADRDFLGVASQAITIDYTQIPDDSVITIQSAADVATKRAAIIQYLWGNPGFPTQVAQNVGAIPAAEISTAIINSLTNLSSSSKLQMSMELNQTSNAYLFRPVTSNRRAVILHDGHRSGCHLEGPEADFQPDGSVGMTATLKALIADGYTVVLMFMPRYAPTDCSIVNEPHKPMFDLVPASGKPMKFFLEPVARAINYLQTLTPSILDYSMTGLSGGGWTTTVYAAIDTRISVSIPVAGSMPLYLSPKTVNAGDFEHVLPEFYGTKTTGAKWGFLDLYVLGSYGSSAGQLRRQIQVLNRRDDCCFTGNIPGPGNWNDPNWLWKVRDYETRVQLRLGTGVKAQEFFRVDIDDASVKHQISRSTIVNVILLELNRGRRRIGAATAGHAFVRGLGGVIWRYVNPNGWENTGLQGVGVPAVVEDPALHGLDIFYRDPNNTPMHAYPSQGVWEIESLGGTIISDPVATSVNGRWHLAAIGIGYGVWYYSGQIGQPTVSTLVSPMGQACGIGTPALVAMAGGRLDLFTRSLDRSLRHFERVNGLWSPSDTVFGTIIDMPSAAVRQDGPSIRAYVRNPFDNLLYEAAKVPGGPWNISCLSQTVNQLGLPLSGSPSTSTSGTPGEVRTVIRTESGAEAVFKLPQSTWLFASEGGWTNASPTSVPGGEWVRGSTGTLHLRDATGWHQAGTGLME